MARQEVDALRLLLVVCTLISCVVCQSASDCAFEVAGGSVSSCNLVMDAEDYGVGNWRTGIARDSLFDGGPTMDNGGSNAGAYSFTTTTDMENLDVYPKETWMLTPPENTTGSLGKCLTFAYATDGLSVGGFDVLLVHYQKENNMDESSENSTESSATLKIDQKTTIWTMDNPTSGKWKTVHVSFAAPSMYSLAFKGWPNSYYKWNRGYVAVDDIVVVDGPCGVDCMFNAGHCTWHHDDDHSDFHYSFARSSNKRGTGPSRDQGASANVNVTTGGYAYINSDYPRRSGDVARLISDPINITNTPICLQWWVNMHGGDLGNLRLLYHPYQNENVTTEIWKLLRDGTGNNIGTDNWYPARQTVSSPETFRLIFEATVGFPGSSDIALDTITMKEEPCPSSPPGANSGWGDCDFFSDTCKWERPSRNSGSCTMLSRVRGSEYDPHGHTGGPYKSADMYLKYDLNCYLNKPREKATLTSTTFTLDKAQCLSFYVYMFTKIATHTKFGALSVVVNNGNRNVTVWRLQNHQQSQWTYSQMTIPAGNSLTVFIEGIKGPDVSGMIGLDDITVFDGECPVEPHMANVQPGDCTFDDGLCQYEVVNAVDGSTSPAENWRFSDGDLNIVDDHTFKEDNGGYMYIDALNVDMKSQLKGPPLEVNTTYCLTFYFAAFYSDNSAKLSVYREANNADELLLWQMDQGKLPPRPSSSQNVDWNYGQVEIAGLEYEQLAYLQGDVRLGGWAIDDIKYLKDSEDCKIRPKAADPN